MVQIRPSGSAPSLLPVTILTGFLGAGKTTNLNAFLQSPLASQTAVIVNEFGEIDIDGATLSTTLGQGSRLVSLPNGCICCAVQDDLTEALLALAEQQRDAPMPMQRAIIETTGLADPGAIIRGVAHDPRLKRIASIAQTVTICGADRLIGQLARFPETARQIGVADRIIISKADLVTADQERQVRKAAAAINPLAEIHSAVAGALEPSLLLGGSSERPLPPVSPGGLIEDHGSHPGHLHDGHRHDEHHHSEDVRSFALSLDYPLDQDLFRDALSFLIMRYAEGLLRIKGVIRFVGEDRPRLINGVHDVFSSEPVEEAAATNLGGGAIVFIGVGLPEEAIRRDIMDCEVRQ